MTCASCGAAVPATQRFCGECGAAVRGGQARPDDPLRDELAQALGATYELGRLLGRGGMGAVYLARERALDRMVAVKVLPPEIAGNEESRERFRREARTAARLTHQNIVPLYTFGETSSLVFYVMGFVRGESLAERLRRAGPVPPDETRRILSELAAALDYAHRQGVIHRDIKPDNILIEEESGRPMLADFGIAKAAATGATLTVEGAILGTPQYMSPEQASGERALDGRSDLYSLGILAYAMLNGRPPFQGHNAADVIAQQLTRDPPAIVAQAVPDDLSLVVRRCLEKDPSRRYQTAGDLRADLSGRDDIELTEELQASQGNGLVPVLAVPVLGLAAWFFHLFPPAGEVARGGIPFWVFLATLGALVPISIPFLHRSVRKQGLSRDAAWRHLFALPDSVAGFFPWPAVLRRPGDVWTRLPRSLRVLRTVLSSAYAIMVLGLPAQVMYRNSVYWDPEPRWNSVERRHEGGWSSARRTFHELAIPVGYITAFFAAMVGARIVGRRRGLNANDSVKMLVAPTRGSAFWKKPEIARILSAPGVAAIPARASEPRGPADFVVAIRELAGKLPPDQQMLGAEAVAASRQTMDAIGAVEAQIASLERDADPAELARLEARVAALPVKASSEDEAAMRSLLSSQVDLLRRMRGRLDELRVRRERFVESLRTLWLQIADLRAASMRQDPGATEITGQVRALCEEMQRQTTAGEAVARFLDAPPPPGVLQP